MRIFLFTFLLLLSFTSCGQQYLDGDLIFQHSASGQSAAVQLATNSYYSHCGIIFYLELAFKAYQATGIELCRPKALKDFNLESPQVRRIMQQRYGAEIPYDEPMVSPGQLSESALLYKVH
jgi:hypothetical protein